MCYNEVVIESSEREFATANLSTSFAEGTVERICGPIVEELEKVLDED